MAHYTSCLGPGTSAICALVNGPSAGVLAHRIALKAARAGTPVALIYRSRSDSAARVVAQIEAAGGRAIAIAADVGSEPDVLRAFECVDRAFGGLCGLVNNAVTAGEPTRLAELAWSSLSYFFAPMSLAHFSAHARQPGVFQHAMVAVAARLSQCRRASR